jgi:hypothetical protein
MKTILTVATALITGLFFSNSAIAHDAKADLLKDTATIVAKAVEKKVSTHSHQHEIGSGAVASFVSSNFDGSGTSKNAIKDKANERYIQRQTNRMNRQMNREIARMMRRHPPYGDGPAVALARLACQVGFCTKLQQYLHDERDCHGEKVLWTNPDPGLVISNQHWLHLECENFSAIFFPYWQGSNPPYIQVNGPDQSIYKPIPGLKTPPTVNY